MKRFTERLEDGGIKLNITDYEDAPYPIVTNDFVRMLAEYEDTGLTPQEIEQMKARMPLHQWAGESPDKKSIFGVSVSKIMEWVRVEKEKRLIILNEHNLCEDNAICCDDNCQECAKRVYKAYCKERDKISTN